MKREDHGNSSHETLLEQYKLYVEMANEVSKRRHQTNTFYISLSSALITLFSLIATKFIAITSKVILIIPILGVIICVIWFTHLRSYKKLNSAKFEVINKIEADLPYKGFNEEWNALTKSNYKRLTDIECYVPLALIIPYLVISIVILSA